MKCFRHLKITPLLPGKAHQNLRAWLSLNGTMRIFITTMAKLLEFRANNTSGRSGCSDIILYWETIQCRLSQSWTDSDGGHDVSGISTDSPFQSFPPKCGRLTCIGGCCSRGHRSRPASARVLWKGSRPPVLSEPHQPSTLWQNAEIVIIFQPFWLFLRYNIVNVPEKD